MDALPRFALTCDIYGAVREVRQADRAFADLLAPGAMLVSAVADSSRTKTLQFLSELSSVGVALGWQVEVAEQGGLRVMWLCGVACPGGLEVSASYASSDAVRMLEDLVVSGAIPELRDRGAFTRALAEHRALSADALGPYEELTRTHNELANLQRELAKSHQALTRQREWLWNILAGLEDAVVATGPDGTVSFMNRAAALLTGRELLETAAIGLDELLPLASGPEPDAAPISLRPAWTERRTIAVEGYLRRGAPHGALPVAGMANPLLDQAGSLMGALVLLRDTSSAARVQRLMMESERLSVAAEMAAGIAHTVNNVLLIISGNAEALEPHLPPERRRLAANIRTGVRRVTDLTERLLAFTEAGAGSTSSTDLNDIVREAVGQEEPVQPEVRMIADLAPGPVLAHADPARLVTVVRSILRNAQEAIHGPGRIWISTASEGARVVIRVRDDGEGMAPEIRQRLFTPFVTTKFLGRGLGLASAHAVVTAHGGGIAVESAPGTGTTVTISLPAEVPRGT